ncbi:hypothetical protein ABZ499_18350 [Streptomyces sp. NPDC019990]|uniref:hypothetical protein n=1 Tax=Streptomyces sp. NPDC019990 TaxID=3154693 RepID=UPI0033ED20B2
MFGRCVRGHGDGAYPPASDRARLVKTLNTVNWRVTVEPALVPGEHQVFVCGEDAGAKEQVTAMLGEFGSPADRVLDLGGIRAARAVEMWLPLWVGLMRTFGHAEFNLELRRARWAVRGHGRW